MDHFKFMRGKEYSRILEPLENKGLSEQEQKQREADYPVCQVRSSFNSATLRFVQPPPKMREPAPSNIEDETITESIQSPSEADLNGS